MNRVRIVVAGLAGVCVVALAPTSPAGASTPSVALSPRHTQITAATTAKATFDVHAHRLRSGSRVALQILRRSMWVTLARTGTRHGTFGDTLSVGGPGKLGAYDYRAAVVRAGHVVATSSAHRIHAYGTVSLLTLCKAVLDGGDNIDECEPDSETYDDGTVFHFVLSTGIDEPSDPFESQFGATKTSCRSIRLQYISDGPDSTDTYVELRQPGRKSQKHTSSSEHVSTFTATLTGGPFDVDVKQDASQTFMYFNGSASCWTSTGGR